MGVAERKSYSAMDLSVAQVANRSGSAGLKRNAVMESLPQAKLLTGSERAWSHTST